jgi:hypothetical protein
MVLIVDCVFIIASLIASSFFVSFWKGCVIGGRHVSIMQGEEWNDDDANIKNSPCRINFFLFYLFTIALTVVTAYSSLPITCFFPLTLCNFFTLFDLRYLFTFPPTVHFYRTLLRILMPLYPTHSNLNNHYFTRPPWTNGYFLPCLGALLCKLTTPGMLAKDPELKLEIVNFKPPWQ